MNDIDDIKKQWAQERPDLNTEPMALLGRLLQVSKFMSDEMAKTFASHGLTSAGFDVLATLHRSGPPYGLTPNQILSTMMITSGTLTNRIDKLEIAGLVSRNIDSSDKRSIKVLLTKKGQKLTYEAVTAHVKTQTRLVGSLTKSECSSLQDLLKKIVAP